MNVITYDDLIDRQERVIASVLPPRQEREPQLQLHEFATETRQQRRQRELEHAAAIGVLDPRFIESI